MADKNDMVITARLDAEPAIKEAKQAGPKIAKALDVKSEDKGIKSMQAELQKATKNANTFYEALKKGVHTTAAYREAVAKRDSQGVALDNAKKQLKEYQDQRADYERKLSAQEAKYSGLNSEANAKRIADTKTKIAGLTTAIVNQEKEVDRLQASYNGLMGVVARIEKSGKAVTFSPTSKENSENYANYLENEQHAAELADQITQRYEEVSSATQDASNSAAAFSDTTAESGSSAENIKNEFEGVSEAAKDAKTSAEDLKDTAAETNVNKDGINEAKKELESLKDEGKVQVDLKTDVSKMRISELTRYMQQLKAEQRDIEKAGIPKDSAKRYDKLIPKIYQTQQAIKAYKDSLREVPSTTTRASQSTRDLGSSLKALNLGTMATAIKNSIDRVKKSLTTMGKTLKSRLKNGLRTFTKYILGFRSLFFLIRRLRSGVLEGIENLVRYHRTTNETNQKITALRSSLLYLKNAWAAAFAPIINYVGPILSTFMDYLASVGNAIARFIAMFTGQTKVIQAVKVSAGDYADSLDKAGSSAGKAADKQKKLNDRLADFDDLNVLGKDDDDDDKGSGGGGGGGNANSNLDPDKMFTTVDVEPTDWVKAIKEAWEKENFATVGYMIAGKIADMLNGIDWDTIKQKANKLGENLAKFINGFFGNKDLWNAVGVTLGQGVNTAIEFLAGWIKTYKPGTIGGAFNTAFRRFLKVVNWKKLGSVASEGVSKLISGLAKFIKEFPTKEIWQAIKDFFSGIDWDGIWESVKSLGEEVFKKIFGEKGLGGIIEDFTSGKIDVDLSNYGFTGEMAQTILDVSDGVGDFYDNVQKLAKGDMSKLDKYPKFFKDCATEIVNASDKLADFWTLLWPPADLVTGLQEIADIWDGMGIGIGEVNDEIADFYGIINPPEDAAVWWTNFKDGIKDLRDRMDKLSNGTSDDLGLMGVAFGKFQGATGINLGAVENDFDAFDIAVGMTQGEFASDMGLMGVALSNLKDTISKDLDDIKYWFEQARNKIGTWFVENLKTDWGALPAFWTQIWEKLDGKFRYIKAKIELEWLKLMNKIPSEFKAKINVLIAALNVALKNIFNGLSKVGKALDKLSESGALGMLGGGDIPKMGGVFSNPPQIPYLAQGAVIPPNNAFMAVLGDQKRGTNIEAPLDTIKQAVAEELGVQVNAMMEGFAAVVEAINKKQIAIGDKEIGKANARYMSQQNRVRGTSF